MNFADLEKLTIETHAPDITDTIFEEFDFPKLQYFNCFTPEVRTLISLSPSR